MPSTSTTRPPTLQEIVDHLSALTADSLPLASALAHITLNGTTSNGGQGLGLLSAFKVQVLTVT